MKKKLISVLVACFMLVEILPMFSSGVKAMSYSDYKAKYTAFINDARWRDRASWGSRSPWISPYDCSGCCAYCADFAYYVYGATNPEPEPMFYNANEIKTGDILHFKDVGGTIHPYGHYIVVLERNGNTLKTAEGNYDAGKVRIGDNYRIDSGKLQEKLGDGTWITLTMWGSYHFNVDVPISKVTITFNANGGSCSTPSRQINNGAAIGTLPAATRNGYDFAGWYQSTNAAEYNPVTSSTTFTSNTTLYAHWANRVYQGDRIFFEACGGEFPEAIASHSLTGFNIGRGANGLVVYNCGGQLVNTNYYGREVSVDASGLVTKMRPYGSNDRLTVPANGFVLSGHCYAGDFNAGDFILNAPVGTYVAYDKNQNTVSFYDSKDAYLAENKYVVEGNEYGTLPEPTNEGYIFDGWFTAEEGGTEITENSVYDGYTTLYAHWRTLHDYEITASQDPTCEEDGYVTYTCSECGDTYTETIPAMGHDYVTHDRRDPTCTEHGWVEYTTCSRCSYSTYEEIPALGHDWDDGVVTIPATVTTNGVLTYTCRRCFDTKNEIVPKTGIGLGEIWGDYEYSVTNGQATIIRYYGVGGEVVIPAEIEGCPVTVIGSRAFYNVTSLTKVIIPNSVSEIEYTAFSGCSSLTVIDIPNTVSEIGYNAFSNCSSLIDISLPNNLLSIDNGLFEGCSSLASIRIPDGVIDIGNRAFEGCTSLASIIIPDSVEAIGWNAFYNTAIFNEESNWENEVLYIGKHLIRAREALAGDYTIKDGTVSIAGRAFLNCSSVSSITIPKGVRYIAQTSFWNCSSLADVSISEGLVGIGGAAFKNCTSLATIIIPKGVRSIDNSAFYSCTSLKSVSLPDTLTQIGDFSFGYYSFGYETPSKNEEFIIYGHKNSSAEKYAEENGFVFVEIAELTDVDTAMVFTDVKSKSWFKKAVDFVFNNGLMNGMTEDTFAPNAAMSRAMLVTVLWRAEGSPEPKGSAPFTDLKAKWYKKAVAWAYENEIVNGMTATTFAPDAALSREQIAAIMYRFTEYKGGDVSGRASLDGFPDGGKTHNYAKDAMSWAVYEGLISGVKQGSVNYLDPRGNATRAQVATILMRYLEG